jgi:hypothetical protein
VLREGIDFANKLADLDEISKLMARMSKLAEQWYTPSDCPFVRSAFLDVVSLCGITMLRRHGSTSILNAWEGLTASVSIGPQYAFGVRRVTGDDLLRQSLAQIFFVDRTILRDDSLGQMVSKEYQSIGDALMLLATKDQDTCCTALDTLDKVLQLNQSSGITVPLDLVMAHVHRVLLHVTDPEVISKAQAVLASGFANSTLKTAFFKLVTEEQVLLTLTKLEEQCLQGPPSNMQSALHLLGFFLDFSYTTYPIQRRTTLPATARYIRLLRMTIIDTNPFDMRFAAVQSLSALTLIWHASPTSKTTGPLLLSLSLVLYDMLNDDDDEIRDVAALASTSLFRAQDFFGGNDTTVPILTAHRLAKFLATRFDKTSPDLANEALKRLADTSSPFARVLADARTEDTALFATEKQNLYKDDTLDAVLWARVLASLQLSAAKRADLKRWVLDALSVLTETAEKEVDGALGWSSKSEVFTLGIRVFCAAEVVLDGEVMMALRRFADVGNESEVHGLWIEKVERVLEKRVVGMLGRVKGTLLGMM